MYVFEGENGLALVDCGPYSAFEEVNRVLRERFPGKRPQCVYLTHHHFDHAGAGSRWLDSGAQLIVSRQDFDTVCNGGLKHLPGMFRYPGFVPTRTIDPDEEVSIGEHRFKVFDARGHTPGSICFISKPFIITGDLGLGPTEGHWFTFFVEISTAFLQSRKELLNQLDRLACLHDIVVRGQHTSLLPGHGEPVHYPRTTAYLGRSTRILRRIAAVKP
jgi:glyoxylase-like metal-dependent hydrolase (beta-lactamase superfamily II)